MASSSNGTDRKACCNTSACWIDHPGLFARNRHSEESGFFQPDADFFDGRHGVVLMPDCNI